MPATISPTTLDSVLTTGRLCQVLLSADGQTIYAFDGIRWLPISNGGRSTTTANDAARLALSPDDGDHSYQTDTGSLWTWDGTAWKESPARGHTLTFAGAGDQADMATNGLQTFTKKATAGAAAAVANDWVDWEAEVWVDGANSAPAYTVRMLWGTALLEQQVITAAAANDYVIIRGHGRISGATTLRNYAGLGEKKQGGVFALTTHVAPADLTIQALTSARDVTVTIQSSVGHASNLATLKSLRFDLKKAVTP